MTDHERLIHRLLRAAGKCNSPVAAAEQLASITKKAESYYGPDHEETLNIRDSWANCLDHAGDQAAAIACNEETLRRRLRSKSFGKSHESTLELRRLLADAYEATDEREKAVQQYQEVIRRGEEHNDHTDLFEDVCTVACMLVEWGQTTGNREKIMEANQITTKYFEMAQTELPRNHESLLYLSYNIGYQLGALGKNLGAIERFKDVIKRICAGEKTDKTLKLLEDCQHQYSDCLRSLKSTPIQLPKFKDTGTSNLSFSRNSSSRSQSAVSKAPFKTHGTLRKEHARSKSNSTVDGGVPDKKSKVETTTDSEHLPPVRLKLPKPAEMTGRPRSASTTLSLRPAEPFPRPASVAPSKKTLEPSDPKNSVLRTFHANNVWKDSQDTLKVVKTDKRSSSVGPPVSRDSTRAGRGEQFFESNTDNESERWFIDLQRNAHRFLNKYHRGEKRVSIALLDTGVALKNPSAVEMSEEIRMDLCDQVERGKRLQNQLPSDHDVDGHGSECAYLLTRVSPFARIISYRIVETRNHDIVPNIVEEALRHAIKQKVDIISMSFGFPPTDGVRKTLIEAKGNGVLMFAATSNDGGPLIKFPASSDEVFAIDAAKCTGGLSSDNPGATSVKPHRFTALGEILSLRGSTYGSARRPEPKTGSSFATPIAAATAALILEFANQPPLAYDPMAMKGLKMLEGMRAVLIRHFSIKNSAYSEFNHINIEHFQPMKDKEQWNEGGGCDDFKSDRYQAADMICKVLKETLDEDAGKVMIVKILERMRMESEEKMRRDREKFKRMMEEIQQQMNDMVDEFKTGS